MCSYLMMVFFNELEFPLNAKCEFLLENGLSIYLRQIKPCNYNSQDIRFSNTFLQRGKFYAAIHVYSNSSINLSYTANIDNIFSPYFSKKQETRKCHLILYGKISLSLMKYVSIIFQFYIEFCLSFIKIHHCGLQLFCF